MALEGGEGSASRPGRSLPRKRHGTHCTGGWVGPRAGLDRCGKSRHHRDSIRGPSSPWPVAIPTELPGPCMWGTLSLFVWYLWQNFKYLSFAQERFVLGAILYVEHCVLLKSILLTTNFNSILCGGILKFGNKELVEWILNTLFLFSHTYRISCCYQRFFYSPTDAQVNCLINNFKIDIKIAATCFGVNTIIRERIIRSCWSCICKITN